MIVNVYRDCDARLRLRKVVVEIYKDGATVGDDQPIDRSRMFGGPLLASRLPRRIIARLKKAEIMNGHNGPHS